jgi:hypothetical protein
MNIVFDTSDLRDLYDDIEEIVNEEIKETLVTVQAEVVKNTNVDTGLARSNWQVSKGSPPTGVMAIGSANANAFRAAVGINYTIGADYFLSNNVDYVHWLNNGSSRRAGEFFVETSITAALRRLNRR